MKIKVKKSAKKIDKTERNKIACKAIIGESVTEISNEYNTDREFVYA